MSTYVGATKTYQRRVVISGLQVYNDYTISVAFGNSVGLVSTISFISVVMLTIDRVHTPPSPRFAPPPPSPPVKLHALT